MAGTLTKLTFSGTQPSSAAGTCSPSPDGLYIAVAAAGGVFIYKRNGAVGTTAYTYLTTIALSSTYCIWSHDGATLAIGRNVAPWVSTYRRTGDSFAGVTTGAVSGAGSAVRSMAFSDDDTILALALTTSSQGCVAFNFNKASSAIGAQITLPSFGSVIGEGVAFAGNDLLLACRSGTYFQAWRWGGSSFTKLTNDTVVGGNPWHIAVTDDDQYAIMPCNASPYIAVFKVSGTSWIDVTSLVGGNIGVVSTGLEIFDKDRLVFEHAVATTANRVFFKKSGDVLTLTTRTDVDSPLPFQSQYSKRSYDGTVLGIAGRASPGFQAYFFLSTDVTITTGNAKTKPFTAAATAKPKIKVTTGNSKTKRFTVAALAQMKRALTGAAVAPKFTASAIVNTDATPVTDTNPWQIYGAYVLYESPFQSFATGSPDHPYGYASPVTPAFTTDGMIKFPIDTDAVALMAPRFVTDGYIKMPIQGTITARTQAFIGQAAGDFIPRTLSSVSVTKGFTMAALGGVPLAGRIDNATINPFTAAGTVKVILGAFGTLLTPKFKTDTAVADRYKVTGQLVTPMFSAAGLLPVGPGEAVNAALVTRGFTGAADARLRVLRRKVRAISVV